MIKIVIADENGILKLTKKELETLLNESFNEGYAAGSKVINPYYPTTTWETTPSYRWDKTTVTCDTDPAIIKEYSKNLNTVWGE